MKLNLSSTEKKYLQEVLSFTEAEKYIKKFKNKIFVIKYGGSALSDKYLANNFAKDLVLIKKLGINLVVVHGGGVQISETLKKEMGFVGKPKKIKIKIIKNLLKKKYIPIIASLGFKEKKVFNINADTVAGALASSLSATRFYFITNIKGVMDKNNKLIKEITPKKAKELIKNNIIKGGMIPKVETCLNAVKKSANAAVILDGRVPKLLLKEIFTTKGVGTLIGKK